MLFKAASAFGALLVLVLLIALDPQSVRVEDIDARSGFSLGHAGAFEARTNGYQAQVHPNGELEVVAPSGHRLAVRTLAVRRGDQRWERSASADVDEQGVVRLPRGPITETMRKTDAGVAQRWEVPHEPAGEGPLWVELETRGPSPGKALDDDAGVRFAHRGGALVYGGATWIDAAGRRTPLSMRFHEGRLQIEVPHAVIDDSSYPAVLDPVVGPEVAVDEPEYGPQIGDQVVPSAAWDGSQYLVVWRDYAEQAVTFARVDAAGSVLDVPGILVDSKVQGDPAVAFDGTNFVIAWAGGASIWAVRVTPEGVVLDVPAREIYQGDSLFFLPFGARLASGNNGRLLVTYQLPVKFFPPNAGGLVIDSELTAIGDPIYFNSSGYADVVFDGSRFFVGWLRASNFFGDPAALGGAFVDPMTAEVAPLAADLATDTVHDTHKPPGMVLLPSGVFVTWADSRNVDIDLYGRFVAGDGSLSAEQLVVQSADDDVDPIATPAGGAALFAYRGAGALNCDLCVVQMDVDGTVMGPPSAPPSSGQQHRLAGTQSGALLTWNETQDVWSLPLGPTGGTTATPTLLSVEANAQHRPSVVRGADQNLVVWYDERGGITELRAARFATDGLPLAASEPLGMAIASEPDAPIAMGTDGDRWIIGFVDGGGQPSTLVVSPSGAAAPVTVDDAYGGYPIDVFFDGDTFVLITELFQVACIGGGGCDFFYYNFATRLDADGNPVGDAIELDPAARATHGRGLAVDGASFIVFETVDDIESEGDVVAVRLPHGSDMPSAIIPIATALGKQSQPAVASDGERLLVVWRDEQTGGSEIRGRFVLPDGSFESGSDGELLISSAIESSDPLVVWTDDGHSFLVIWVGSAAGAPTEIYGAWVTQEGEVLDFPGVPLTASDGAVIRPSLAPQGAGQVLLSYERRVDEERAERVVTRMVSSGGLDGAACVEDDDCASRSCEDGVCCAVACGTCETCNGDTPGRCTPVVNGDDDSCFGSATCDENGDCKKAPGQPCDGPEECSSGFCIEGLCCDTACDGSCDSCVINPGTCVTKDCGNYGCNPDKSCLTQCEDSTDCAPGFQCTAERTCEAGQPAVAVEQGCGCFVAGEPGRGDLRWLIAVAALAASRRRSARPRRASPRG